jgi:predicted MPP superfamily phosphohydrolase
VFVALLLLACFAAPQLVVWLYVRRLIPVRGGRSRLFGILTTTLFAVANAPWVLIAHALLSNPAWRPPRTPLAGAWVVWQMLGVVALVGIVVYEGSRLLGRRRATGRDADHARRAFLRRAALGTAAFTVGVGGYGLWNAGRVPLVHRRRLALSGLPPALQGFTVAHLTDIHAGFAMDEEAMRAIVQRVADQRPDLVVITGDMVDGGSPDVAGFGRAFRDVAAPHGVIAVLGNHDHYVGAARVSRAARDAGIRVLVNGYHVIERGGEALVLLGVDDPQHRGFDPPQGHVVRAVAEGAPGDGVRILLAHRPGAFDTAAELGIPLMLAGHTHGGQIGIPLFELTPARLISRYPRGHYRRGASQLYVSAGVGTTGVPLRIGIPPEVALLTLSAEG